jgi:hypothetical protein
MEAVNEHQQINATIAGLYEQWIRALQQKEYAWFERHIAEDLSVSTHPIPGLAVTKAQFIEGEKTIESIKARTISVHTHVVDEVVVSIWVAKVEEERVNIKVREIYGPKFPLPDEFYELSKNKTMIYMDGWRKNGGVWQCFDHHMIGPSE